MCWRPGYLKLLRRLHALKRPRSYLEIGTVAGKTLAIARCTSVAVDPRFRLARNVRQGGPGGKPACHLFEMTSDAFFAAQDLTALFGGSIDLAFIDGMHHCEFALRDFMNIEPHCRPDSFIVMHHGLPVDEHMARRDPRNRSRAAPRTIPTPGPAIPGRPCGSCSAIALTCASTRSTRRRAGGLW